MPKGKDLWSAAGEGFLERVKELCESGADVNYKRGDWKDSPLHRAAEGRHSDVVQYLCSRPGIRVNEGDMYGETPLHVAADKGHSDVVKHLCNVPGISVNEGDKAEETPLHRAAQGGHSDVVQYLCSVPDIRVNEVDKYGWTPLHVAVGAGHSDMVKHLCSVTGISVNAGNEAGNTPLHMAARAGHSDMVKHLCSVTGISVNVRDKAGETPLHRAARWGHSDVVQLLCTAHDISVNEGDSYGRTPLYVAIDYKKLGVVKVLCDSLRELSSISSSLVNSADNTDDLELISLLKSVYQDIPTAINNNKLDVAKVMLKSTYHVIPESSKPEALKGLLEVRPSIVDVLSRKYAEVSLSENVKTLSSEMLNEVTADLQLFADHPTLQHVFFSSDLYKHLIEIIVGRHELDQQRKIEKYIIVQDTTDIAVVLKLLYISLQAKTMCIESMKQLLINEIETELFDKFTLKIRELIKPNESISVQCIAMEIEKVCIKESTGCIKSARKCVAENADSICNCIHRKIHKCNARGNFSLIFGVLGIYFYASDLFSDTVVGMEDYTGFSTRLGAFEIFLVIFTLVHENVRSAIELYSTEEDILKIKLGKSNLGIQDWKESDLNYGSKYNLPRWLRFFWPFKMKNGVLKALLFNFLSLVMLRPIVDRLIVLTHSSVSLRTYYRYEAKQNSLKQCYLILEQLPELLVQFYTFQIVFIISTTTTITDQELPCLDRRRNFATYETKFNDTNMFCDSVYSNGTSLALCGRYFRVYSMLIPFLTIPLGLVSLEQAFRKLDPATPTIPSSLKYLLQLSYFTIIPARVFLFSGLMHVATVHFIVTWYIIDRIVLELLVNITINKGYSKFLKKEGDETSFSTSRVRRILSNLWSLSLFSIRDVFVISLREPDAYMKKPSEVTYDSLRGWKKLMTLSLLYLIEGFAGAILIERYYPCEIQLEVFKYLGWVCLILLIFSVTLLVILSDLLNPKLMNIIPEQFLVKSLSVSGFGFMVLSIAALVFYLVNSRTAGEMYAVSVVLGLFVTLLGLLIGFTKLFGVAKKKDKESPLSVLCRACCSRSGGQCFPGHATGNRAHVCPHRAGTFM